MLWLVPTKDVNIVSGFLQAVAEGARDIGWGVVWLPAVAAAFFVVGNIGGVGAWLTLGRRSFKSRSRQRLIACDSGLPSVVIWFRMRHARLASTSRPLTLRARRPSPIMDL